MSLLRSQGGMMPGVLCTAVASLSAGAKPSKCELQEKSALAEVQRRDKYVRGCAAGLAVDSIVLKMVEVERLPVSDVRGSGRSLQSRALGELPVVASVKHVAWR